MIVRSSQNRNVWMCPIRVTHLHLLFFSLRPFTFYFCKCSLAPMLCRSYLVISRAREVYERMLWRIQIGLGFSSLPRRIDPGVRKDTYSITWYTETLESSKKVRRFISVIFILFFITSFYCS